LSDHGELLLDHNDTLNSPFGEIFDGSLHVPLIIKAPGLAPRRISSLVELTDVMPTLLDLVGLPKEKQAQGRSLVPYLKGNAVADKRVVSEAFPATRHELCAALRNPPWVLVRCPSQEDALFQSEWDPRLLLNQIGTAPDIYRSLAESLNVWERNVPAANPPP